MFKGRRKKPKNRRKNNFRAFYYFKKLQKGVHSESIVFFLVGFLIAALSIIYLPRVSATEGVSITKTSDADFNEGTFSGTVVSGTGDSAYIELETPYPSSGTWTSSSSESGVIDLKFNGGWGDGTDDSIAFEAHVTNVDSEHSIKFEMRVASTLSDLTAAEWEELGTIDSGSVFTKTRGDLISLGFGEGTNRYVQVKITLYSDDGYNTPRLNDFNLYYLKDNDAPANLELTEAKNEEGGERSLDTGGWYNYPHPYFKFEATDNCDPIPGCAEGVTPCCSGIAGYYVYFGTDSSADPETEGVQTINNYYIADGLVSGETYYLRIKPYDVAGNTGLGETLFTYQYDNVPPSPPGYIITPPGFLQTRQFIFTWPVPPSTDAASDDNSDIEGYQYKINDCPWYGLNHTGDDYDIIPVEVSSYETDEYDYGCLREGTNYIYLRSKDGAGNFSNEIVQGVVRINTIAPGPPTNLRVTPSSSDENSFSFSWNPPSGNPPLSEYRYSVNSLPSETNYISVPATQTSLPAGPYATLKGVNTFYIVAVANSGAVNYENYASIQFTCDAPAPGPPKNLDIFDVSIRETQNYKISLSWDPPDVLGTGFVGYKIYRSERENASCSVNMSDFTPIATTTGTAYVDSGLQSKQYYYCVVSYNNTNQNSIPSSTVDLIPTGRWRTPPNLIKTPSATAGVKSAIITWMTDRAASSFVRYGTKSQVYSTQVGSSDYVTSHTVSLSGLNPNTTYFYRVVWIDEDGNQGISQEYSFTTGPAPTVSNVSVSDISLNSAYLSFTVKNAVQAKIYYGKSTSYGGTLIVATSKNIASYTTKFSNLEDDTLYHYMIELYDEEGNKYPFEDHTFKTLPKPRVFDIKIQQLLDRASPTLEITYNSNIEISTVVDYYPEQKSQKERTVSDLKLKTAHKIEIADLQDNTVYILNIKGNDAFGNEAISSTQRFVTATDTRSPLIYDLFIEKRVRGVGSDSEVQVIVRWKTDELATSQVVFGQGAIGSYNNYTLEDLNLVTDHTVVLSGLRPSTIYHLAAASYDVARNKTISEDRSILTPKITESALDIVIRSLKEIFGLK